MGKHYSNLKLLGVSLVAGFSSLSVLAFDIEETRTLTLKAAELESFEIDVSAGSLTVIGKENSNEIHVSAELRVNQGEFELVLEQSGDSATLRTEVGDGGWLGESPYINLVVEVPRRMALDITDGSGFIKLHSINNAVNIKDGSGSIEVGDIKGNLKIKDGSGSLDVNKVDGSVKVDDGSGSIEVRNVTGPVEIEDGSGGIVVTNLKSTLDIEDGSGSMSVSNISGHVTIDDGSGSIDLNHLENGVTILEEGSGGLSMNDVKGDVVKK